MADVSPNPGARRLLERAKAHDATVGIVTSNSSSRTRDWLARIELSGLVDFIVAGEHVVLGKPNAEPYLLAASRASVPSSAIVAVEDSLSGVRSACLAGLRTFAFDPDSRRASWPDGVEAIESLDILADRLWPNER